MPQTGFSVENNFVNGLITEASGLNFPVGAVTETYDCVFNIDGSVERRPGFDLEDAYITETVDRSNKAISTYTWRDVAGNGDLSLSVVQVGDTLYFYQISDAGNFSQGILGNQITMTGVSGAPSISTVEAQYSSGNGLLFVTHPYCDPFYVSYDTSSEEVSATTIAVNIRDFTGDLADTYDVDERPTATLAGVDVNHLYNLYNQGWNTANLTAWDTAQTTMPSNADVMWRFVDSSDDFDAGNDSIARVVLGNTPAPKGHFILDLFDQDRDTAAGTSGATSSGTGYFRPSSSAFFAGRLWFTGISATGFNSNIYFSQIVSDANQYGNCYQYNDPTASDLFDILPSDGGVISIPDAGTIYKLQPIPGGLCVFSANGIWFITGSTGLGFTATDYTVQQISRTPVLNASSFVNVAGRPMWWSVDNIYTITQGNGTLPNVQPVTFNNIKSFYDEIPVTSKRFARGFYDSINSIVRWVYRESSSTQITSLYEFNRVLNYNVLTNAFYPWTISDSDVKVNAIVDVDLISRSVGVVDVVDSDTTPVVDGEGNQIIAFTSSGTDVIPFSKFLVSYPEDSSYELTFASCNNTNYVDWETYGSVDYTSYFISGYRLLGTGGRRFQNNWVRLFSRVEEDISYYFQGIWDFANTGDGTGRWSTKQYVNHTDTNYSNASKRLKVRGRGLALQFKVTSKAGEPFHLIGWNAMQTVNTGP